MLALLQMAAVDANQHEKTNAIVAMVLNASRSKVAKFRPATSLDWSDNLDSFGELMS